MDEFPELIWEGGIPQVRIVIDGVMIYATVSLGIARNGTEDLQVWGVNEDIKVRPYLVNGKQLVTAPHTVFLTLQTGFVGSLTDNNESDIINDIIAVIPSGAEVLANLGLGSLVQQQFGHFLMSENGNQEEFTEHFAGVFPGADTVRKIAYYDIKERAGVTVLNECKPHLSSCWGSYNDCGKHKDKCCFWN